MEQLKITAEKGHYLKPFAQIFLALAAMREKQEDLARIQLLDLAAHFPDKSPFPGGTGSTKLTLRQIATMEGREVVG